MKQRKNKLIVVYMLIVIICILPIISIATTNENTEKITEEELSTFENIFNKTENNGFLSCIFTKPSEIDLNRAFRECGSEDISAEEKEYLEKNYKENNPFLFEIATYKFTEENLIDIYESKTGEHITHNELIKRLNNYIYVEKYKTYYQAHGDTSYQKLKCVSGEKISDNTYKILLKKAKDDSNSDLLSMTNPYNEKTNDSNSSNTTVDMMEVTIKKAENNYIFISNVIYDNKNEESNNDKENIKNDETKKDEKDTTVTNKSNLPRAGKANILIAITVLSITSLIAYKSLSKYKDIK